MPIVKSTSEIEGQEVAIYIEVEQEPKVVVLEEDEDEDEETREGIKEKVDKALKDVGDLYGKGLTLARQCGKEAIKNFHKMDDGDKPDEVELQLAIKLGAAVDAVLVVSGEAQINVTMKWKLKKDIQKLITQDNSQQAVS